MKRVFVTFLVAIFATALFAQTKTVLKPADLPKNVSDYVAQMYKDFTIDKAYKVDNKGVMTYLVIIKKGTEIQKLSFDKNGNFSQLKPALKPVPKKTDAAPVKKDEPKPKTVAEPINTTTAPTAAPAKK